ncbi:MAG: hypothetical protein LBV45_07400 [Xanthomonadaceae bacterium]|nr:hypothetical protein [Xanthomonadaceae bacterium]
MKLHIAFLAAAITLGLAACKPAATPPADDTGATPAATTEGTTEPTATEPGMEPGTEPAAEPSSSDTTLAPIGEPATSAVSANTGVPECDEYINKVNACITDSIPAAHREEYTRGLEQMTAGWSSIPDKAALAEACKSAHESSKQMYAAQGCSL